MKRRYRTAKNSKRRHSGRAKIKVRRQEDRKGAGAQLKTKLFTKQTWKKAYSFMARIHSRARGGACAPYSHAHALSAKINYDVLDIHIRMMAW